MPSKPTTERLSSTDWENQKDFIKYSYLELKQTPDEVLRGLSRRKFEVSLPQLQHKLKDWSFKEKSIASPEQHQYTARRLSKHEGASRRAACTDKDGGKLDRMKVKKPLRRHKSPPVNGPYLSNIEANQEQTRGIVHTPSSRSTKSPTSQTYSPERRTHEHRTNLNYIMNVVDEGVDMADSSDNSSEREEALSLAVKYSNIASAWYRKECYEEAGTWYEKVLDIQKDVLGDDHPYTLETVKILNKISRLIALLYRPDGG